MLLLWQKKNLILLKTITKIHKFSLGSNFSWFQFSLGSNFLLKFQKFPIISHQVPLRSEVSILRGPPKSPSPRPDSYPYYGHIQQVRYDTMFED